MIDRAKRLADIEAAHACGLLVGVHDDRDWLLSEVRDADAALAALRIPDDGRPLAERIKALASQRSLPLRTRRIAPPVDLSDPEDIEPQAGGLGMTLDEVIARMPPRLADAFKAIKGGWESGAPSTGGVDDE